MALLEIKNLVYSYDETSNAIDHVDLSLNEGQYVTIIGHNGSGKSTLAKLILGLLEPKEGEIEVFGEPLNAKNVLKIRQKVGIVFQNPDNQFIGSTVRDDIAFGLENRCIPQAEMDDLNVEFAKKVGMENYLDKEPTNLSGGQKQRVAIAGVLAMHPQMIIFDEATVMLDPKGRNEIRNLILAMRKENPNLTILSITHDVEEATQADEVIVMNHGKVFAQGKPHEVFAKVEELKKINLRAPFLLELQLELSKRGVAVEHTFDFEEMVVNVCPSD